MISINKSIIPIPKKLLVDGVTATNQLKALYLKDKDYQIGKKKFEFKRSIYAHKTVKKALKKIHFHQMLFL